MDSLTGKPAALSSLTDASPSVQAHLALMQSVINRMASNSASCKTWCVTLVSAILVVVADKHESGFAALALFPVVVFFALDAYYLALEKGFRSSYNAFVENLHQGAAYSRHLFAVEPEGDLSNHQLAALRSFSIWGFYLSLVVLIGIAWLTVLRSPQ